MKEVIARPTKHIYKTKNTAISLSCTNGWCKFKIDNGEEYALAKNDFIHYGYEINIIWAAVSDDFEGWAFISSYDEIQSLDDTELKIDINRLLFRPRVISGDQTSMEICDFILGRLAVLTEKGDSMSLALAGHYLKILVSGGSSLVRNGIYSSTKREDIIVDKFIDLASNYFKQSRKEQFYAEKLGINPKYLTVVVKKTTGRSPNDWIDDYNLYYIKRQLVDRSIAVQDICNELDFATPSHFTKFFKDKTGMTPSAYRKSLDK